MRARIRLAVVRKENVATVLTDEHYCVKHHPIDRNDGVGNEILCFTKPNEKILINFV